MKGCRPNVMQRRPKGQMKKQEAMIKKPAKKYGMKKGK